MKAKPIIGLLIVLMICIVSSISQGADRFYYGTYGGHWIYDFPLMRDSLKFNIVYDSVSGDNVQRYVDYSLRAIVSNNAEGTPAYYATCSHYTMWEAEGLDGSYYKLSYYEGGTWVNDPNASGGKARKFTGSQTGRLIQWGPTYLQERGPEALPIKYTAEFCMKFYYAIPPGPGIQSFIPPTPLCAIMVVNTASDSILKADTLYKSDFYGGTYKTFTLVDYTVSKDNKIEFQIYLFGMGTNEYFFVDYVKAYDQNGSDLIEDPFHIVANQIKTYVSQSWVRNYTLANGDTVVYRWYLRDEPRYIDAFEPGRYIDSLLRIESQERFGFQAFNLYYEPVGYEVHEYLLRVNPNDYSIDPYPTRLLKKNYSGEEYQAGWDTCTGWLNRAKIVADSLNKDFWAILQAHYQGYYMNPSDSCCPDCSLCLGNIDIPGCYCSDMSRLPTPNELRLQTFLALCYGANSILNFCYYSYNRYIPAYRDTCLMLGLQDCISEDTAIVDCKSLRWREITDFTGPRVQKLGPIFNQLTWEGACFHDSVGSFVLRNDQKSYIDSIVGTMHPESTYVQVGFFEYYGNYFMLVNRKCLQTEQETLKVYFDLADGPYFVIDQFTDSPVGKICGFTPFTVSLQPGEGKLFRLEKYLNDPGNLIYVRAGVSAPPWLYPTIQQAIDVAGPWTTILVEPDTVYYENINFNGRNCTVASFLHDYDSPGDTSYIRRTIIDGSHQTSGPNSASVVRFISGENSNAVLKGFTIRKGKGTLWTTEEKSATWGGGIYCRASSPIIMNNIIMRDTAQIGGGICCYNSSAKILNNIIKENVASLSDGGGIDIEYGETTPVLVNNIIVNNVAQLKGGGIYYHYADPFIINNTIDSNSAAAGGGIYVDNTPNLGFIENNIIVNSLSGGGITGEDCPGVMSFNDVWNNTGGNFSLPNLGFGYIWTENRNHTPCDSFYNIIQNPNFVNGYHLGSSSACINAGGIAVPYMLSTDLDGNPRIHDGFVDMGAYEYQGGFEGGGAKIASGDTSSETQSTLVAPKEFGLSQSYPNPFNPVTIIQFTVGSEQPSSHISLRIYNVTGQLVKTLVDEEKAPGTYTVSWDGKNNAGEEVASGIYFYQLKSNKLKETKRMMIIR